MTQMAYRALGRTGLVVSAVGFGTSQLRRVTETPLDRQVIRQYAERFSTANFKTAFTAALNETPAPVAAAS